MKSSIIVSFLTFLLFGSGCNSVVNEDPVASTLFEKVSHLMTKIDFVNLLPESPEMNSFVYEYYYNGGGVAAGDLNQDGLVDLFFTANLGENKLYLNRGKFLFQDITETCGVAGKEGWSTGCNIIDLNGDGKLDIYVCYSGPFSEGKLRQNEVFINQGNDRHGLPIFKEKGEELGLASSRFSMQSAFLDFDLDGDLDMYLLNHNPDRLSEDELLAGRLKFTEIGDQFYRNDGGTFTEITKEVGIYSNSISYGLGIGVSDLNNDGWPDIYVSNDYEEYDYLYINDQSGKFIESIKPSTAHTSNFSMGNDMADFDNDGFVDIVTVDMIAEDNYGIKTSMPSMNPAQFNKRLAQGFHHQYMFNTLQRNTSHVEGSTPFFQDVAQMSGMANTGWSWAPLLVDFDNDGFKDLFISNGIKRDFRNNDFQIKLGNIIKSDPKSLNDPVKLMSILNRIPKKPERNYLFRNNGDLTFENASDDWMGKVSKSLSNGAIYADLDNDGDYDLVVNNVDENATILRNSSTAKSLSVSLKGNYPNPNGIGARVEIWCEGEYQLLENYTTKGYLSSVAPNLIFGIGEADLIDSLKVTWCSRQSQMMYNVTDSFLTLEEKNAKKERAIGLPKPSFLSEVEMKNGIKHKENYYDDYQKQVLLPHKLSQFGPAISVGDINKDGLDDLFVGSGFGFYSFLYTQTSDGEFVLHQKFESSLDQEDVDALFFDGDNDGDLDLYVVTGGNEFEDGNGFYLDRYYLNVNSTFVESAQLIAPLKLSGSKVRALDYDQDNDLDLLVTSRHVPGDYPTSPNSVILENDGGRFIDRTMKIAPQLLNLGMVTDAVCADLDNNGMIDIALVGEWMKPTILFNQGGVFEQLRSEPLDSLSGWYFSIEAVDIDQNGTQDLLLGNLGLNYKYDATFNEPFEVFYDDFDSNGSQDIVLGYYNNGHQYPVRGRQCSSEQVPELKADFETYHDFASSSLEEIYHTELRSEGLKLSARNFSSGILMNTVEGFQFIPLPNEIQVSNISDFYIHDLDQDGFEDILAVGNLYASEIETPRNDASFGWTMLNKHGQLEVLSNKQSGFFINGNAKRMEKIKRAGDEVFVVGLNNDDFKFFKVSK